MGRKKSLQFTRQLFREVISGKNDRKFGNSLLLQFTGIVLLLLVLLTGAFCGIDLREKKLVRENILQMNEKVLLQIDGKIKEFHKNFRDLATSFVYSPTVYQFLKVDAKERILAKEDLLSVCSNVMDIEDMILGIYLFDEQMEQLADLSKERRSSDKPDIRTDRIPEKMLFGDTFQGEQAQQNCYLIYFPVYDLDSAEYGVQLGMAVFWMRMDNYAEMLEGTRTTEHSQMYLADRRLQVIASDGAEKLSRISAEMMRESEGFYIQTRPSCVDGWRIVCRIPEEDLHRGTEGISWIMRTAFLAAVILMGFLILFCYFHLVRPIRQIDGFMKTLSGQPELRLGTVRKDEIGTVIQTLNRMLDDLEDANQRQQESQKKMYEMEIARRQLQIMAFRNQINPHFLYNTFECIRGMALYYEAEDIAEITMALSRVFRFAVKGENFVTIQEEMDYIREYAKIIDYRFMGKIKVKIELDPEIAGRKVIKLLLQPLLENAGMNAFDYILKPVEQEKLNDILKRLMEKLNGGGHMPERSAAQEQTAQNPVNMTAIKEIANEIRSHYTGNLTLASFSKRYGFSVGYLSTLLKEELGMSFSDYITEKRIQKAKELLADPRLSIEQIAEESGYHDYFYFTKVFTRIVGISPSKYRKQI